MGEPTPELDKESWLHWMCKRVQLNDPEMPTLNLSNVVLKPPEEEPAVIPVLFEGLSSTNTTLTDINLSGCGMRDIDCATLVGEMLKNPNTTLKNINLDSNLFGIDCIEALCEGLLVNTVLEELRFSNQMASSQPGRKGEQLFAEAMKENKTLCKLGYSFNDPTSRNVVDKFIMNNSGARRKRLAAAKKAAAE
jgi:hypothetical protein